MKETQQVDKQKVLVLGMPGSGKTVFLSVLGTKYTTTALLARNAPLGIRLKPNVETALFVQKCQEALSNRRWPQSTLVAQAKSLSWDVLTGERKQFEIASFDYAGEIYERAFLSGGLTGSTSSYGLSLGDRDSAGSIYEQAKSLIHEADEAGVICIFISLSRICEESLPKAITAAHYILSNPDYSDKCLVVLTQSYDKRKEIAEAGGPELFLEKIGGAALSQCISDKIPVIELSSVNETEEVTIDSKVFSVPKKDFTSQGLLGVLLVAASLKAKGELKEIGDKYRKCLTLSYRYEYCKLGQGDILSRLKNSRAFFDSAKEFDKALNAFLSKEDNFISPDESWDSSLLSGYKKATDEEPEFLKIKEDANDAKKVEEAWMRAIREQLHKKVSTDDAAQTVISRVKGELNSFSNENDDFIFGFYPQPDEDFETTKRRWINEQIKYLHETDKNARNANLEKAKRTTLSLLVIFAIALACFFSFSILQRRSEEKIRTMAQKAVSLAENGNYHEASEMATKATSSRFSFLIKDSPLPNNFNSQCMAAISFSMEDRRLGETIKKYENLYGEISSSVPYFGEFADLAPSDYAKVVENKDAIKAIKSDKPTPPPFMKRAFNQELKTLKEHFALLIQAETNLHKICASSKKRKLETTLIELGKTYEDALTGQDVAWTNYFVVRDKLIAVLDAPFAKEITITNTPAELLENKILSTLLSMAKEIRSSTDRKLPKDLFTDCKNREERLEKLLVLVKDPEAKLEKNFAETTIVRIEKLRETLPSFLVFSAFNVENEKYNYLDTQSTMANRPVSFYVPNKNAPDKLSCVFYMPPKSAAQKFQLQAGGKTIWTRGTYKAGTWHGIRYVSIKMEK